MAAGHRPAVFGRHGQGHLPLAVAEPVGLAVADVQRRPGQREAWVSRTELEAALGVTVAELRESFGMTERLYPGLLGARIPLDTAWLAAETHNGHAHEVSVELEQRAADFASALRVRL